MKRICIGVHVHAESERLRETLAQLHANTDRRFDLLLLPDGPDRATRRALEELRDVPQSGTGEPRGAPACFNRLIRESDADCLILLESGSLVGPDWLEHLKAALEADARNGLAGPSTNRAWNVQNAVPRLRGIEHDITTAAAERGTKFGESWCTLEPLYCLADFCYAVKREVVDTVGAADEDYGPGPCWEMDYTIRAVRAGFQVVWAKGAYVFRHPATMRRRRAERERLVANKHRYQDKFCGQLLRGERTGYSTHCRGDDCPHFAPAGLIRTHEPNPEPRPGSEATPAGTVEEIEDAARAAPPNSATALPVTSAAPLVSCIMPTHNRRAYVGAAIGHFLEQDYPARELIIVDDGSDPVGDLVPADRGIRYVHLDERLSTGEKRNRACGLASGDIICHWDDDDWHAPWRLAYQVRGLIEHDAEICGLDTIWFHDPVDDRTWKYRYSGATSRWLAGLGTLCYQRRLWERHRFADIVVGEDNRFVRGADAARVLALENDEFYVARVHSGNTSRKLTSGSRWHCVPGGEIRRILGTGYESFANPTEHVQRNGAAWRTCPSSSAREILGEDFRKYAPPDRTGGSQYIKPQAGVLTAGGALAGMKLNLGCCDAILDGYVNVDIHPAPGVEVVDLRETWPWPDGSVEYVRAWDIIEHLPDKIFTMNELWRVLKPGGHAEIVVPTTDGSGAWQDPTHVSYWNRRSFLYYEAGNPYRERFARSYGIQAKFRTGREQVNQTPDGPRLTIVLQAVKP